MAIYKIGTVNVTASSISVVGVATGWLTSLVTGGMFSCNGQAIPILSVQSNTQLTLAYGWTGTTASGAVYAISLETADAATAVQTNKILAEIVARINAGTFLDFDGTGTLVQRAAFNLEAIGFVYCQTDVTPFLVFIKRSATSGDWSTGTPLQGPAGTATNGTNGTNGAFTGAEPDNTVLSTDKIPMRRGAVSYMPQSRKASPWNLSNLLQDGGRFGGKEPNTVNLGIGAFTINPIFIGFNGGVISDGGKYVDNSLTYGGGVATAVNANIQALITAIGLTGNNARFQPDFHIALVTAGSGTVRQQATSSPPRYTALAVNTYLNNRKASLGFWVCCLTGKIGMHKPGTDPALEPNSDLLLNGVSQGATHLSLLPADGWKHVHFIRDCAVNGTSANRMQAVYHGNVYAEPSSTFLIALPLYLQGLYFPDPADLPFITHSAATRES